MDNTRNTLNNVYFALSDPTRRDILARTRGRAVSVGALAQEYQISQPAVSRHLKVLERAGLVRKMVSGKYVYVTSDHTHTAMIQHSINSLLADQATETHQE